MKLNVDSLRVRCVRNINAMVFANRFTNAHEADLVVNHIRESLPFPIEKIGSYYERNKIKLMECQMLYEKGYINKTFLSYPYSSVIIDEENKLSTILNTDNHIKIASILPNGDFKTAYEKVRLFNAVLEEKIDFAFMPKYGYLSPNLLDVGNGYRFSAKIFLPALSLENLLPEILANCVMKNLSVLGHATSPLLNGGWVYQVYTKNNNLCSINELIDEFVKGIEFLNYKEGEALVRIRVEEKEQLEKMKSQLYISLAKGNQMTYEEFYDFAGTIRFLKKVELLDFSDEKLRELNEIVKPYNMCVLLKNADIHGNDDMRYTAVKNWFVKNVR